MDILQELAISDELSGFSQKERAQHIAAINAVRDALTEYSKHTESLPQPHYPVDDIVLILASALGKDRLVELVDAVSAACYKLEHNSLAVKLEDLAHDAYVKQNCDPYTVHDQLLDIVVQRLKLTPYKISQTISNNSDHLASERRRTEVRWQRWLSGEGLKTIDNLESDLNALGYELRICPK